MLQSALLKNKKAKTPKRCKTPKNHLKILDIARETRKTMKKGKIKNEKYKKGLTMTINFFTFIFCI